MIEPGDVGRLSCAEIEAGLDSLSLERNVIAGGSLAGATALAIFVTPWAALPMALLPSARGDRGEFALKVGEVVKGCPQGEQIKGSSPKDQKLIAHPAW